jgi:transposase-like protein
MNTIEAFVFNFKNLKQMEETLKTNDDCIAYLEELVWEGIPVSPFDETSKVYRCKNGRYKCKNTNKYFSVLTGTIFENTKLPLLTWFKAMFYVIANRCGVS